MGADSSLRYAVISNSKPGMFDWLEIRDGQLTLFYKSGSAGMDTAVLVVGAFDTQGGFASKTLTINHTAQSSTPATVQPDFRVSGVTPDGNVIWSH